MAIKARISEPCFSSSAMAGKNELQFPEPQFGVGPMDVRAGKLITKHKIKILDDAGQHVEDDFDFIPIKKKAPAGLWGNSLMPSINGQGFIEDALSGFEIRPKNGPAPGMTSDINRANLEYDSTDAAAAIDWEAFNPFNAYSESDEARRARIRDSLTQTEEARNRLLQELGLNVNLTIDEAAAGAFLVPPQIGTFAW